MRERCKFFDLHRFFTNNFQILLMKKTAVIKILQVRCYNILYLQKQSI